MEFTPVFECTAQDGVCPYRNGKGVCIELVDASDQPWVCDYLIVKRKLAENGTKKLANIEA